MTYVTSVCKMGQGADCCRFLVAGPTGFNCAKLGGGMASLINARVAAGTFTARGDNCDGRPYEEVLS